MRGKGKLIYSNVVGTGITPAYAGKSGRSSIMVLMDRDHPRLCGEKQEREEVGGEKVGSPPPMRGKGVSVVYDNGAIGITPAYAGKRRRREIRRFTSRDHPRLCGEKMWYRFHIIMPIGSPPPMRGKDNFELKCY